MRNKIVSIVVVMLLFLGSFSMIVSAGSEEDPEIVDNGEDTDLVKYLDVMSAWFYEKENEPDYLYTALKMKEINPFHMKQHLVVHWVHNGIKCASGMHIGYGQPWFEFAAGYGHGWWFQEHYQEIEGEYDEETGIITCKIPKNIINNPQKGDVLENTYASAFQRFGFIGRMGFDRAILRSLIYLFFHLDLADFAPEPEDYGRDYVIQY
ncbi:MAG: hypothetical protein QCI00_07000 [Candidatus Thermoplasmatota archaeon]|nr:hypothetical protein [Candidatus Thermoplasmatota archaeon]